MSLSNLIKKGGLASVARAIPAIPAIPATDDSPSVNAIAEIAQIAVARPAERAESKHSGQSVNTEGLTRIRRWLAYIGEQDERIIEEIIDRCKSDPAALDYFVGRADEVPEEPTTLDDRRSCLQCTKLARNGACQAARQGELPNTSRDYFPAAQLPRRCEAYLPNADDLDRRSGMERWPGLGYKATDSK